MRKSKFSEHQIIAILKAVEAGQTVRDVCREREVSEATYYQTQTIDPKTQIKHLL